MSSYLAALQRERHALTAALTRLAPGAHLLRVHPDGTVTAYRPDHTVTGLTRAHERRITDLLRAHYDGVDWNAAHDYYLAEGMLRAAPQPGQRGTQPATDGTYGSAPGPRLLTARARTGGLS